jgi:hypothetical protein
MIESYCLYHFGTFPLSHKSLITWKGRGVRDPLRKGVRDPLRKGVYDPLRRGVYDPLRRGVRGPFIISSRFI